MPRGRPVKCPYCGSTNTRPKGHRKTVSLGLRRIRRCLDCNRRFTQNASAVSQPVNGAESIEEPATTLEEDTLPESGAESI
jgi:transcriptional regulator NrdR family protein